MSDTQQEITDITIVNRSRSRLAYLSRSSYSGKWRVELTSTGNRLTVKTAGSYHTKTEALRVGRAFVGVD